jgi:hypothetical protein
LTRFWPLALLVTLALAAACAPGPPLEPPAGHPAHPEAAQAPAPEDPDYVYSLQPDPALPPGGQGVRWGEGRAHQGPGMGHGMGHGAGHGMDRESGAEAPPQPDGHGGGHGGMGHD